MRATVIRDAVLSNDAAENNEIRLVRGRLFDRGNGEATIVYDRESEPYEDRDKLPPGKLIALEKGEGREVASKLSRTALSAGLRVRGSVSRWRPTCM
jgi:hypothetical protein